ncbi:Glutathione S-transferase 2 [Steccherinum ochraceum]|uniref:Glutathione S-transferase 2 n=1 Tax=Steccherinum ochraceum TaxID=92696 RepID=A0A4R0R6Q2_9APHY|nr:Glutathione S-transferase 2 [Steccherinum ochraceum]
MSGQGPYMGQAFWFSRSHAEQIPSAVERYKNETKRHLGVLESVLLKQEWLVGGKLTIADIIFVPWNNLLDLLYGTEFNFEQEFPATFKWHSRVTALPGNFGDEQQLEDGHLASSNVATVQIRRQVEDSRLD